MSNKVTIKIKINDIIYPVTCEAGDENRLIRASDEVNKSIDGLSNISNGISENRLLAMTSLVLADKLIENSNNSKNSDIDDMSENHLQNINELLAWLHKATERMNKVAKLLETK